MRSHRFQIALVGVSAACALVAFSARARAQTAIVEYCKKTETQAECHTRLKCKANEDVDACQRRLLKCTPGESLDDCKKRADARRKEGEPGQRDQDRTDRDRADERERERRERDEAEREPRERRERDERDEPATRERRERDEPDREARERRGRDEGRSRRRRGGRRGDGGRGGGGGGGGGGSHAFVANKTFGLGLELGEPTGLTGKVFVSDKVAFDFGLGWIYEHYYYDDGAHLYGDVLFHPVSLVSADAFELPLYIGGGLRFWSFEYCDARVCTYDGTAVGIRIPIGIAFDFNEVPLDIFIQVVPVIDFLYDDYYDRYRDRTHLGVDFSVGIRYWFL